VKRGLALLALVLFCVASASPQQSSPANRNPAKPTTAPQDKAVATPEFLHAADEVLATMSKLLDLPVKAPLKRSIRTKDEIRAYLINEQKEDKDTAQRYADTKALEAFGFIPRNFSLDAFLLDLLTEQVAGLYDPKNHEFYIADWIPLDEQKPVMAHELTHALDDQYFHIDAWEKAARPNDDAEFARDAVVEGSAVAAMVDYSLLPEKMNIRDMPDISTLMRESTVSEALKDPMMAKAPPFIRDSLLFPYLDGATFTQQFLKANSGWADFERVFEIPPTSTQQIIHPELYFAGVQPLAVSFPSGFDQIAPHGYRKLEENVLGEFGLSELLKQYLTADAAAKVSPEWAGDRYAVFESADKSKLMLVFLLRLNSNDGAAAFFGVGSSLLAKQYASSAPQSLGAQFVGIPAADAGAWLRCVAGECLLMEGAGRETMDRLTGSMHWPSPAVAVEGTGPMPQSGSEARLPAAAHVQ
jgi:hypothetical protein